MNVIIFILFFFWENDVKADAYGEYDWNIFTIFALNPDTISYVMSFASICFLRHWNWDIYIIISVAKIIKYY